MKKTTRILIVDDNKAHCENLTDILKLKGYEVVSVQDGFKALEFVKDDGFDLVLMDIKMPVMNGVETFKKIKEIAPQIPIIMMTAYAVEELIKEALLEGAFGVLHKPLDIEKLHTIIKDTHPDGKLVLVVDDDPEICTNLSEILGEKGYRVKTAGDGKSAVHTARENNFDVMLLDMKLPILNGLETYLSIREIRPEVVAIFITAHHREMGDFVDQAMERGAYACLEKPLDIDQLLTLLKKIE